VGVVGLHSLDEARSKVSQVHGLLNNEQNLSSSVVAPIKSIMDHDASNDPAATIKDPKESSIEPCRDNCAAEGGDEAREVEDAEKENLLSGKG
jgi:hypothetical protein